MALFKNDYIDLGHGQSVAPKEMPPELVDGYTMGGRMVVRHCSGFDTLIVPIT
jgi:hypothetical protein